MVGEDCAAANPLWTEHSATGGHGKTLTGATNPTGQASSRAADRFWKRLHRRVAEPDHADTSMELSDMSAWLNSRVQASRSKLGCRQCHDPSWQRACGAYHSTDPFDRILLAGAIKTIPAVSSRSALDKSWIAGDTAIESQQFRPDQILRTVSKSRKMFMDEPMPDRLALLSDRELSDALALNYCKSGLAHSPSIATLAPAAAASQALE